MLDMYGNPSSTHSHGREARSKVEYARRTVAQLLNTTPSEIFFTSGGTEGDNTAIRCSVEAYEEHCKRGFQPPAMKPQEVFSHPDPRDLPLDAANI